MFGEYKKYRPSSAEQLENWSEWGRIVEHVDVMNSTQRSSITTMDILDLTDLKKAKTKIKREFLQRLLDERTRGVSMNKDDSWTNTQLKGIGASSTLKTYRWEVTGFQFSDYIGIGDCISAYFTYRPIFHSWWPGWCSQAQGIYHTGTVRTASARRAIEALDREREPHASGQRARWEWGSGQGERASCLARWEWGYGRRGSCWMRVSRSDPTVFKVFRTPHLRLW